MQFYAEKHCNMIIEGLVFGYDSRLLSTEKLKRAMDQKINK